MMKKQVGWRERISYGLSDTASNLIFQMITIYLMFFYTDVYGISATAVASLFLITRILDAFADPMMGIIIDKTNSKWGKSRPYFLWLGIPFAIIAIMTFYTPDFSSTGKIVYAYITYTLLGIIYSGINIPITSILPSMTSNPQERTELASIRMFFAFIGMIVVSVGTLPIVKALGGGDQQKGFFFTMILFSVIGGIFFIITFLNVKERVVSPNDKPLPFRESIKAVKGNVPWFLLLASGFVQMTIMTMQTQTTVYFWTYNMKRPDLIAVTMALSLVSLITLALSALVSKKIGKRNTMIMGSSIMIIGYTTALFGSNIQSIPLILTGMVINSLGQGFSMSMAFAMIADTVDYGEWKSGVRAQGLLSAAISFGAKVGMGVGGALSAAMLSFGKYVPGAEQQAHSALVAIKINYLWAPLLAAILGIIIMKFYKLDRQIDVISEELETQRVQM
ncbi:glycoside-pentoside-hexuronide (GPH):cation symporter [Bacillus wiedmannii]|uniref:glycoside-pentoside-hexuronide (GPH):cation symporter n=1 Tax=Bacillus wiedmannii TaxID=1890302 RepID=UPI003D96E399